MKLRKKMRYFSFSSAEDLTTAKCKRNIVVSQTHTNLNCKEARKWKQRTIIPQNQMVLLLEEEATFM
jgi:hypothetical protein